MNKLINPQIAQMSAYKPPLDGRSKFDGLLLDFSERTIPVGENVREAVKNFAVNGAFRVYPEYFDILDKIANYAGCEVDQLMITNGSDQGIDLIFRSFLNEGDKVYIPYPSFAMFYQSAGVIGADVVKYDLNNLNFDSAKLIIICNPNNPTGELVSVEDIEKVLQENPDSIVFVDEAYFEFSKVTAVNLINCYSNLIITRTFSKAFGLVAFRIGYLISNNEIINELLKVRGPYDVNSVAVVAVSAALDDLSYVNSYVDEVMIKAKPMVEQFFADNGIEFTVSFANFIVFKPKDSSEICDFLKDNGILVRPRSEGKVRVSIGTVKQMEYFIEIYKKYLTQ